jgi:hypothetical protein
MKIKQNLQSRSGAFITATNQDWLAGRTAKPVRMPAHPVVLRAFYFSREKMARMNKLKVLVDRIKIGLAIAVLTALTGCVGFVGGGYADGGGGWWGGDGGGWWGGGGGGFDRGHDVHAYSDRGVASRAVAHGGGGGGHASGGGGGHGGGGKR